METIKAITTSFGTYRTEEEADLLFQKYENSLKAEFYENGFNDGEKRGEKRGERRGIKQGIEQENIRNIKSMYNNNIGIGLIARITGKSEEEINKILINNK